MPEGDTLFRTATVLRRALLNQPVTGFESRVPAVADFLRRTPVTGRSVTSVESRGKHLLITFSCAAHSGQRTAAQARGVSDAAQLVLHTHLRMTGSWHLYRPAERWLKPERRAVVVLRTPEFVAPCFSAPVVELMTERQAGRHPDLLELGPDAMTPDFDAAEACARMRARPQIEIAVALMNQRVLAGVGNVYKSEVLFIRRLSPFRRVAELEEEELDGLVAEAHRLLRLNENRGARRTRFALDESGRLWVYGRSGEPCRVCAMPIRMRRQGVDARSTYFCSRCQNVLG